MSSSWNMIAIHMLFYTDVSADSNLKEDRKNGQTTSEMTALFWADKLDKDRRWMTS